MNPFQVIANLEVRIKRRRSLGSRVVVLVIDKIINRAIAFGYNPTLKIAVHDVDMALPMAHALWRYAADLSYYDTSLPQLAKFLIAYKKLQHPLVMVDIGANIGDSAKLVAATTGSENVHFVCIEADESYIPMLQTNTAELDAELHHVVAAAFTGEAGLSFMRSAVGTSSIVSGDRQRPTVAIDDLLNGNVVPDIIKIDTDGYEFEVLRGLSKTLSSNAEPIIFLEFSPEYLKEIGSVEPISVIEILKSNGYDSGLIYDHLGYPMGLIEFTGAAISNLINYCLTKPGFYVDIVTAQDRPFLSDFYASEIQRFSLFD